jgi:hypothetical protein
MNVSFLMISLLFFTISTASDSVFTHNERPKNLFNLHQEKELGEVYSTLIRWSSYKDCVVNKQIHPSGKTLLSYYFTTQTYSPCASNMKATLVQKSFNENSFVGIYANELNKHTIVAYQENDRVREFRFVKPEALRVKCSRLNQNVFYIITDTHLEKYDFMNSKLLKKCVLPETATPDWLRFIETANPSKYIFIHSMFGIWEFNAEEFKVGKQLPFKAMRCKTNEAGTLIAFSNIFLSDNGMYRDVWIYSSEDLDSPLKKIDLGFQFPRTMKFIGNDKYLIIGMDRVLFEKIAIFNIETGEKYFETEEGNVITHNPINIFPHGIDTVYIRNGDRGWFSLKLSSLLAYEKTKQEAQMDINQNN